MPPIATCSLTFDDGPDPVWTPLVLDCLLRGRARSTFFVMAERAGSQPALIERMLREGHEVAFHCLRHVRHSDLDEPELRRDTEEGLGMLAALGARATRWRPPWGVLTASTTRVAADHQLALVGWSADPEDWAGAPAARMHERVLARLVPGAVVLLHDGLGPGARRSGCADTVELIPRLLGSMRQRGLHPTPVSGEGE